MDYAPALLISIHAPHEGERPLQRTGEMMQVIISIHAPHEGERPEAPADVSDMSIISIHAPHEGERRVSFAEDTPLTAISIHAPHEGERRGASKARILTKWAFQSTLPTRGSDIPRRKTARWCSLHFNPRSPRGGATFCAQSAFRPTCHISIHAPHEGERRGGLVL